MLWLGYLLCACASVLLLAISLPGRPARGEALVGTHLITGPMAIAFAIGLVVVVVAVPLPSPVALVALGVLAPGFVLGLTLLPLAAYGTRRVLALKAALPVVLGAPFALGHGAGVDPLLPWAGALVVALVGVLGTAVLLDQPTRRLRARVAAALHRGPRAPSQWEQDQVAWQRTEWAKLPADASVAALLGHARALADDVRAACHARLAAHPDLDRSLVAALRDEQPGDALWYLTHHYPRARQPFAAPINELLARLRGTLLPRLRADPHERPWTGDLMPALEGAVAVLLAGGDVRAELRAWQDELAATPKLAGIAQEIAGWLRRAG